MEKKERGRYKCSRAESSSNPKLTNTANINSTPRELMHPNLRAIRLELVQMLYLNVY